MKKMFSISKIMLPLFLTGILFLSCKKKTFDDALPQVTLKSVTLAGLDSVTLTVQVTSNGASAIEYQGVAFNTNPSFSALSNQVLSSNSNSTFTINVHAYHDTTYYFKAFAANSYGYNASNVIKYTVSTPPPAIAPCTLTNNRITDNGSSFGVSAYGSSNNPQAGAYTVVINGNEDIYMSFPAVPYNGIYTTTSDDSNVGAGQVYISISNFNQYVINSGQQVYVSLNNGTTTISTCSLHYNIGSSIATMYGKVTY